MSHARAMALSALLALGCDPGDDVVARLPGAANVQANPNCCAAGVPYPTAGAAPQPELCGARPASITLLSKAGTLYELHPDKGVPQELGTPACLSPGAFVAALDLDGRVWVVPEDGRVRVIEPQTLKCELLPLALQPSAMAFVYDPQFKRQLLYAIEGDALIVLNPDTMVRSPIGTLSDKVQFLGGDVDGQLFGFTQTGDAIMVGRVAVQSALVKWLWEAVVPAGLPLQGAAAWSSDFLFIFPRQLYRFRGPSSELSPVIKLLGEEPGFLAVAASPCSTRAR